MNFPTCKKTALIPCALFFIGVKIQHFRIRLTHIAVMIFVPKIHASGHPKLSAVQLEPAAWSEPSALEYRPPTWFRSCFD